MRAPLSGWRVMAGAAAGRRLTLDEIARADRQAVATALRATASAVTLADGDVVCRVLGRHKLLLDGRDLSLTPHLALDGYWELPLTRALLRLARPGMHVADVGANVGYHTLVMASAVGASGRVEAFEPNPALAARLRRTLALSGFHDQARVHAAAAGAAEGETRTLHFDPRLLGGAYLSDPAPRQGLKSVQAVIRRLDAVPGAQRLALVKIDAEGSEADVWSGMAGLIAGPDLRTVILEWEPTVQPDPPAAVAAFTAAGFSLGLLDPDGGVAPTDAQALLHTPGGGATMLVLRR